MWLELWQEEEKKISEAEMEHANQLERWRLANLISTKQDASKKMAELRQVRDLAKANANFYKTKAISAGEWVEPVIETELESEPQLVEEKEMTPEEAMATLLTFLGTQPEEE